MIKKLYQKGGIVYIDNTKHRIKEMERNYFIIQELSKNNNLSKNEIFKKYYQSKGFTYTL